MRGDNILPDWLEQGTESSLRDTPHDRPPPPILTALGSGTAVPRAIASANKLATPSFTPMAGSPAGPGSARGAWTDLDKFYASEESEEEGSEESGEEGVEVELSEEGEEGEEESSGEEEESEEESEEDGEDVPLNRQA
jgi:AP-3 complex subunit beta